MTSLLKIRQLHRLISESSIPFSWSTCLISHNIVLFLLLCLSGIKIMQNDTLWQYFYFSGIFFLSSVISWVRLFLLLTALKNCIGILILIALSIDFSENSAHFTILYQPISTRGFSISFCLHQFISLYIWNLNWIGLLFTLLDLFLHVFRRLRLKLIPLIVSHCISHWHRWGILIWVNEFCHIVSLIKRVYYFQKH